MAPMDAVIQYLDWALLAAYADAHPDCREIHIRLNLVQRSATTSFVKTTEPPEYKDAKVLLDAMDIVFTALTGPEKFNRQGCIEHLRNAMKKYKGN